MQSSVNTITRRATDELAGAIDIGWLNLAEAEFYVGSGGFTGLRYGEKDYPRVALRRALPVGNPMEYISVADTENKEIGMLRAVSDLADGQLAIVVAELEKRYYCPQVNEIKSVKDKLGYVYLELIVSAEGGKRYPKNCAVKDVVKNIRMLDMDRLILFDVDGNRYIVRSLEKLDPKSLKRLEPYLFS